jgi:hypothetical protein
MDNQKPAAQDVQPTPNLPAIQIAKSGNTQPTQAATADQLKQVEKEMNAFERATLRWAKVAVLLSGLAALFVCAQWYEMHTGSQDTHALAQAADTQAKKMTTMSDAADKIRQAAQDMVAQDQRIADNSKQALDASNRQSKAALDASIAASRNDQRAWVAVLNVIINPPEIGKSIEGGVTWRNSGKTFARRVTPNCNFVFVQARVDDDAALEKMRGVLERPPSVGLLAPNAEYKTMLKSRAPVDETDKTRITGDWFTYVWGEIVYEDVFKRSHTTKFCSWRQGATSDFLQCPFHNEAD